MRKNNWEKIFFVDQSSFSHISHTPFFKKACPEGGRNFPFVVTPLASPTRVHTRISRTENLFVRLSSQSPGREGQVREEWGDDPLFILSSLKFSEVREKRRGGRIGRASQQTWERWDDIRQIPASTSLIIHVLCTCAQQYAILKPFQIHSISSHQWKVSESFTGVFLRKEFSPGTSSIKLVVAHDNNGVIGQTFFFSLSSRVEFRGEKGVKKGEN